MYITARYLGESELGGRNWGICEALRPRRCSSYILTLKENGELPEKIRRLGAPSY